MIHSPPEAGGHGITHFLTKDLAKAGIAIELLTMKQDTIILVDENHAIKAFGLFKNQIDQCIKVRNKLAC